MAKNFLNDLFLFVTPNFLHWSVPFRLSPLSATVARVTSDPPVAETKMVDSQSSSHLWSLAFDAVDYCPLLFFLNILYTWAPGHHSLFSSYLNASWSLSPLMGPPYVLDPNMLMCPRTHSSYLFSYLHSLSQDLDICYFLCLESSSRYPQTLLLHLRSGSWVILSVSSSLIILLNYTPSLTLCIPSHLDLIFSTTVIIIQHIYNYLFIYRPTLSQNINPLRAGNLSVQFTVVLPAVGTVLGTRSLW